MASGRSGTGTLGRFLRWGRRKSRALLDVCRSVGFAPEDGLRLLHAPTSSPTCSSVASPRAALRYVRSRRRGLTFVALLCSALMWNGEAPHIQLPDSAGVTRVMIVDDHPVFRRGLTASLLSFPDFEIVGEAGSGEEAVRVFEQVRPDIILMDLMMPGMGGISAIRAIRETAPEAKIMVLSMYEEGDLIQEALQAGAIGYQLKGVEVDDLVSAIRQTVSGIPSLAPAAAQSLVRTTRTARKLGGDLTVREREVLNLLARGLPNTAIAEQMVVTVATVKYHLRSIRSKLGTKTRTETVAVALQNRLIPPA